MGGALQVNGDTHLTGDIYLSTLEDDNKSVSNILNNIGEINNKFIGRISATTQDKPTTAGTEQLYKIATKTINRGLENTVSINTTTGKATVNQNLGLCRFMLNSQIYSVGGATYLTVRAYKNGTQIGNMRFKPSTSYETRPSAFFYDTLSTNDILEIRILSDKTDLTMQNTSILIEQL